MKLKFLSIFFIINILNVLNVIATTNVRRCWDHINPLNPKERIKVPCYSTTSERSNDFEKREDVNMFNVTLRCLVDDETLCNKVQAAFDEAGRIITETILFNTQVTVNASFVDFCTEYQSCTTNGTIVLGGASPAKTIQLTDDDGIDRLFPQSLVKQMNLSYPLDYSTFDILALFNSNGNYWFDGDGSINQSQSDFLFVILHELIHGLGFTTGYDDYINYEPEALTPEVTVDPISPLSDAFTFSGFVEYIFDKFMVILPSGKRVTDITKQLNNFTGEGVFSSTNEFVTKFKASPQYPIAEQMFTNASTPNSLGLLPVGSNDASKAIILETSLVNYVPGSSISHVDFKTYSNTSDFLMKYLQTPGITLSQFIKNGGDYSGGPIGPKLRLFLKWIGYIVKNDTVDILYEPTTDNNNDLMKESTTITTPRDD
ncbi:1088_t:CDS:2 [Diversispora eburnea]|uniref:1088_t:CDS:1 n=1 Tax=Diversispora eburnea TaxID=1213867 RepID=A0A9N9B1C3_9GLOM|nr:1088_t:CDS:2 [Diversispora eburnea]